MIRIFGTIFDAAVSAAAANSSLTAAWHLCYNNDRKGWRFGLASPLRCDVGAAYQFALDGGLNFISYGSRRSNRPRTPQERQSRRSDRVSDKSEKSFHNHSWFNPSLSMNRSNVGGTKSQAPSYSYLPETRRFQVYSITFFKIRQSCDG